MIEFIDTRFLSPFHRLRNFKVEDDLKDFKQKLSTIPNSRSNFFLIICKLARRLNLDRGNEIAFYIYIINIDTLFD